MKVFFRLGGACLDPGGSADPGRVLLTRTRWYCLPVKPPVTLWEEADDGVIYTVSCRSPVGTPRGEGPVVSRSPPGQSRALKAGSLPRLTRHLLEAQALGDTCYVPAFLATYRAFAPPHVVLLLLLDRIHVVAPYGSDVTPETADTQRALGALLCSWIDGYPADFEGLEPSLQEQLLGRLRWALGSGSEAEKSFLRARTPAMRGEPEEEDEDEEGAGVLDDRNPDPHYILGLQAEDVAAQLTLQDSEFFLRLVPHECLGSQWSQRDKKGHERACPSVRATVAQFNRVANAVVASCLGDTGLRAMQRARLLEKWIRVAEECLCLRNFTSLYAVISALQSTPLHRLKRTWEEIARESLRCYEELSAICSEEDNYRQSRRLLFQETGPRGTSADPVQRRQQKQQPERRSTGVVPYLGTFLKDLVMLDTAMRNRLKNGYINFEKHRKEFEILTQLRLLQAACRNYTLPADRTVQRWLRRLPRLSEAQSYQLSCAIDPPGEGVTPTAKPLKPALVITRCTDLLSSVGMGTLVSWEKPSAPQDPPNSLLTPPSPQGGPSRLAQHPKWPSVSALDTAPETTTPLSPEGLVPPPASGGTCLRGHRRSASCGSAYPSAPAAGGSAASDCRIIRVRTELQNGTLYKSILVTSQDKAPAVIMKVLEKHSQDRGLAPTHELVQLLPEGRELAFPPTANIFYAMNSSNLDFVLRPKRPRDSPSTPPPPPPPRTPSPRGGVDNCATFPKIKATGRKIAKALF